jgi:hypothetical protein
MITNMTRNMKNNVLAMSTAAPATPKKPNAPAINAITKNINAHLNIIKRTFYLRGRQSEETLIRSAEK